MHSNRQINTSFENKFMPAEKFPGMEIMIPRLEKSLASLNEEYLQYLQLQDAKQKALKAHEILESMIQTLPKKNALTLIFSTMSSYLKSKLNPEDEYLRSTYKIVFQHSYSYLIQITSLHNISNIPTYIEYPDYRQRRFESNLQYFHRKIH